MKQWIEQLSLRDKRILSIASLIVICAVLIFLFWMPLKDKNAQLRIDVDHNLQLLAWMQAVNEKIQSYHADASAYSASKETGSPVSLVQNAIKRSDFSSSFSQLKQTDNDVVQFQLQNVNFDKLILWLTKIWQENGLIVLRINITPIGTVGNVNADLMLGAS